MKSAKTVKELEIAATTAVRDLLGHVPNLEISSVDYEEHIGRDQIDLRIALSLGGVNYALIVEVKPNGAPRFVRSAIYHLRDYVVHMDQSNHADDGQRLIPMLVSPYLSPESRARSAPITMSLISIFSGTPISLSMVFILTEPSQISRKPKAARCVRPSTRRRPLSCALCCAIQAAHGASPTWPKKPMRALVM